jgi:hypothetical protein
MIPFDIKDGMMMAGWCAPLAFGIIAPMQRAGVWLLFVLCCASAMPASVSAQSKGRTPSGPVGASMALLATLEEAGILPPEGSVEANRAIQIVIQFQGLFMKTSDAAVRQFVDAALTAKFPGRAEVIDAEFRKGGWTSQFMEAVCDHYPQTTAQERALLAGSFARANMRPQDFESLRDLLISARYAFEQQGKNIHRIFAEHRRKMPGGQQFDRKERRDGDEGLHTHQGQDGPHEGRSAGVEKTLWS